MNCANLNGCAVFFSPILRCALLLFVRKKAGKGGNTRDRTKQITRHTNPKKKNNNQNPDKESAVPVTTGLDTKQWEGIKVKQMFCNRLTGMILTDCEIKCMYAKQRQSFWFGFFMCVCVC